MVKNITVIGGDLRIVKLAEMLIEDEFIVHTYGLEKIENNKILKYNTINEAVASGEIVIGPLPLTTDGIHVNSPFGNNKVVLEELLNSLDGKTLIAGSIRQEIYEFVENKNVNVIDILKREELSVLNAVSTAEGAIKIAIEETERNIHGSNILIMGFGRIGKILAKMLDGIGAKVSCEARKDADLAWIQAYGYNPVNLKDLDKCLNNFHIIINTIPYVVLNDSNLDSVRKDCLIIDLASNPGGVDKEAVKKRGLNYIWALSLPGKIAPLSSAEFMKKTIYNLINEKNN